MTMKKISAVSVAQTICALLLSVSHFSDAGEDSFKVRDGPVDFLIDRYDDGRSNPYVVTFTDFDLTSVLEFDTDGFVTVIGADEEIYNPVYKTNHKPGQGKHDYWRPHMAGQTRGGRADDTEGNNRPAVARSGPDKCEDCQQTWDTLCGNGVDTVCSIADDDGQVVSAAIEESIHMLCVGFGVVCSELSALDVCDGKCEEGQDHGEIEESEQDREEELEQGQDGAECLPPLTITFEWTPLSELQPDEHGVQSFVDIYVIEPEGQMASWNNTKTNAGHLSSTGNKTSYTLLSGLNRKHATGTYSAFAELWFGSSPVSWTATATVGSGEVLYVENGVFTGNGGPSSTSTRYSVIEEGFPHGTSKVLYANLAEYVDNGCKGHGDEDTPEDTPRVMVW